MGPDLYNMLSVNVIPAVFDSRLRLGSKCLLINAAMSDCSAVFSFLCDEISTRLRIGYSLKVLVFWDRGMDVETAKYFGLLTRIISQCSLCIMCC